MPHSTQVDWPKQGRNLLFATSPEELERGVQCRLVATTDPPAPRSRKPKIGQVPDKWVLSSAVQKFIRRGRPEAAVDAALALHELDPAYLPRRLPTIALEDVGIGGVEIAFDVLYFFGGGSFPASMGQDDQVKVIQNLVHRLAASEKSRAACDLLCLGLSADPEYEIQRLFASANPDALVEIATDRATEPVNRILALHVLSGVTVVERGRYRSISRFNRKALLQISERIGCPHLVSWMMRRGRLTSGLTAILPLLLESIQREGEGMTVKELMPSKIHSMSMTNLRGVPAMALDQHCRAGKAAIAEFIREAKDVGRFVAEYAPKASATPLVGMALFHIEGSKLDRWVTTAEWETLREDVETAELMALGLKENGAREGLYELLRGHAPGLLHQRQRAMEGLVK